MPAAAAAKARPATPHLAQLLSFLIAKIAFSYLAKSGVFFAGLDSLPGAVTLQKYLLTEKKQAYSRTVHTKAAVPAPRTAVHRMIQA